MQSPCLSICRMDRETAWCVGCGRTLAEITAWRTMSDAERCAVMAELPARLAAGLPPRSAPG